MKIMKFWAEWCGPCKMLQPILDEIKQQYDVTIENIDIDKEQELAMQYAITSVPCLIFINDGKEVSRILWVQEKEYIINQLVNGS